MGSISQEALTHRPAPPRSLVTRVLQRCGDHTCPPGGCDGARSVGETLYRYPASPARGVTSGSAPPVVSDALGSPGHALDPAIRDGMGARFGHDFSRVRVHTDTTAARSAAAVSALAYTVGSDLVFARGAYRPATPSGAALLAHELAHVVQQGDSGAGKAGGDIQIAPPGDERECEAESHAAAVLSPPAGTPAPSARIAPGTAPAAVQRRLVVTPGNVPAPPGKAGPSTPFTSAVQGLLQDTCPSGRFTVDPKTGVVSGRPAFCEWHPPLLPGKTDATISDTPAGCSCLCDVVGNTETTTIEFRPGGPDTAPGSTPGPGPGQGGVRTSPTVHADPRFQGQYRINGRWTDVPFHLLLAHEVCGHALPKMLGTHVARGPKPPGGTPPQEQAAVDVERAIAAEHAPPLPRRPDDYSGAARERP